MPTDDIKGQDWKTDEIDLVVADYLSMLGKELTGTAYVKSEHHRQMSHLTGRTKGSIEFKYGNISAVLDALGEPWVWGYKPAHNFQKALVLGVERGLASGLPSLASMLQPTHDFSEPRPLFWEAPPETVVRKDHVLPDLQRLVHKFDPAERDLRNSALGHDGEEVIYLAERRRLIAAGCDDLARDVRWVSKQDGDGAGYDIRSFTTNGVERFLEVKTTKGGSRTPFFISRNEKNFGDQNKDRFRVVRLFDFGREPKAFKIRPPLEDYTNLTTEVFRASFN